MSRTKKEVFAKFEGAAHRRFETRALPSLQEQRNNLIAEMEGIISGAQAETRALTEEESGRFDVIKKEIAAIDKTLAAEAEARSLGKGNEERDHEDMKQRALDEANFVKYLRGETRALDVANNGAVIPQTIADRIIDKVKVPERWFLISAVTLFFLSTMIAPIQVRSLLRIWRNLRKARVSLHL